MKIDLIAHFSLLDEKNEYVGNVEIGTTIEKDLKGLSNYVIDEQYLELKNEAIKRVPKELKVVDFIMVKDK